MSLLTLRLRGPSGVSTIQLAPTSTLLELRASIFSITSIAPEKQEIRTGHPPKLLDTSAGDAATLSSLGLSRGDVLTVQEGEANATTGTTVPASQAESQPQSQHATFSPPSSSVQPVSINAQSQGTTRPPASGETDTQRGKDLKVVKPSPDPVKDGRVPNASTAAQTKSSTAESIRSSLLKSQPFGSSSSRTQHADSNPPSRGGRSQAQTPAARNSRPQQPIGQSSSGAKPGLTSTEDAHVRVDGGWIVLRVVPDDNSCMFRALAICLEHDAPNSVEKLRKVVADTIKSDPETWSEPVLGMEPARYCERMLKPTTWGGAIELAVISKVYQTEIDSVDVLTGRTDRFGEEHNYANHILLIYSGIHYDAVTFTPLEPEGSSSYPYPLDFDQTIFSKTGDAYAVVATIELAQKLKAKHYYTDTAGFALKCEVCKKALKGEKEAQQHAQETGHTSFGEF